MSRTLVVAAVLAAAFGDRECVDVPLVIPSGMGPDSDILTLYLYEYGRAKGLTPRTTITCPQLLGDAPLMCDTWNMQKYCCQSCSLLGPQCCSDQHFTFGVINDTFDSVWTYNEEKTGNNRWKGIVPTYVKQMARVMGFNYTFVPVSLINLMSGDLVQAGVIDVMLLQKRGTYYHKFTGNIAATEAVVEFYHDIVIRKKVKSGGIWKVFDPFTKELWGLIVIGVFTLSGVFWLIEGRLGDDDENRNRVHGGVLGSLYFATSTMLHGGGHDAMSWLGRCLRVGTLFFMLIVTSTYTAELTSILTVETRAADGPETLEAAVASRICCVMGSDEPSCVSDNWVEPDVELIGTSDAIEYCVEKLRSGAVDGIVSDDYVITSILAENCEDFMHSRVSFSPTALSLALSPRVQHLVRHFNSAIAEIKAETYKDIREEFYPESCKDIKESERLAVDVRNMGGLFIIFASYCGAVLCLYIGSLILEGTEEEPNTTETKKSKDLYENSDLNALYYNQKKIIHTLEGIQKERSKHQSSQ